MVRFRYSPAKKHELYPPTLGWFAAIEEEMKKESKESKEMKKKESKLVGLGKDYTLVPLGVHSNLKEEF